MAFLEVQFPTDISNGSRGGPAWDTTIVSFRGGEARNSNREDAQHRYDAAYGVKTRAQMASLVAFFNQARGRHHGFRFKDWSDYQASAEALVPDGGPTVQLIKSYGDQSGYTWAREITKPVAGLTLTRNGSDLTLTTDYTLDTTTGVVTLVALASANITAITQGANAQVTAAAHGYSNGDVIYLSGIGGMTELNGQKVTIANVTTNTFRIGIDTSAYTAYTSGGTAKRYVQPTDTLTWTGEFDVPCRFDTDELDIVLENYAVGSTSVPIVEDRNA